MTGHRKSHLTITAVVMIDYKVNKPEGMGSSDLLAGSRAGRGWSYGHKGPEWRD